MEGIRRALVLGPELIAGTGIEQAPSVCLHDYHFSYTFNMYTIGVTPALLVGLLT